MECRCQGVLWCCIPYLSSSDDRLKTCTFDRFFQMTAEELLLLPRDRLMIINSIDCGIRRRSYCTGWHYKQSLKRSARGGSAQSVIGDRATGGRDGEWPWDGIFFNFAQGNHGAFWCTFYTTILFCAVGGTGLMWTGSTMRYGAHKWGTGLTSEVRGSQVRYGAHKWGGGGSAPCATSHFNHWLQVSFGAVLLLTD